MLGVDSRGRRDHRLLSRASEGNNFARNIAGRTLRDDPQTSVEISLTDGSYLPVWALFSIVYFFFYSPNCEGDLSVHSNGAFGDQQRVLLPVDGDKHRPTG